MPGRRRFDTVRLEVCVRVDASIDDGSLEATIESIIDAADVHPADSIRCDGATVRSRERA